MNYWNYRPAIIIGNGIRNNPDLLAHLISLEIPMMTTWMGADLLPEDHPAFVGRPGIFGQRAANIIQQKATHLFCYGARLDGEQVFYDYDAFAPNARIFVFDIDEGEFKKFPPRYYFCTGEGLTPIQIPAALDINNDWLSWCKSLYARFRPELDGANDSQQFVNPFYLMTLLHEYSKSDDVFAIGSSGNAPTVFLQSYKVKQGQRVSNVCTIGSMGADIPMALGAALATGRRVVCVTGDGGFQMNAQELETIRRLNLPVIFFVLNNNGYNSIRVAQRARFGRVTGADSSSGLTLPDLEAIAGAYRWVYMPLRGKDLDNFSRALGFTPMIVEVFVDQEWEQLPRTMAKNSDNDFIRDDMANMYPYLEKKEFSEIMKW